MCSWYVFLTYNLFLLYSFNILNKALGEKKKVLVCRKKSAYHVMLNKYICFKSPETIFILNLIVIWFSIENYNFLKCISSLTLLRYENEETDSSLHVKSAAGLRWVMKAAEMRNMRGVFGGDFKEAGRRKGPCRSQACLPDWKTLSPSLDPCWSRFISAPLNEFITPWGSALPKCNVLPPLSAWRASIESTFIILTFR